MKKQQNKNHSSTASIDEPGKIPPQASDLEEAVLGALLIEPQSIDKVSNIIEYESFYKEHNGKIYRAIQELSAGQQPIDMLTVSEYLKNRGELDEVGGAYYLSQLTLKVGSAAHVEYHAKVVQEKYIARQLITAGHRIIASGFDTAIGVDEMLADAENSLGNIAEQVAGKVEVEHVKSIAGSVVDEAYARCENYRKGVTTGVRTGLNDLDRMTNGWQKSNLVILAARPGMGKTSFLLHFAKAAARQGVPAAIFSLEMSKGKLTDRLILSECSIDPERYRGGFMTNQELQEVETAAGKIGAFPIYIDDNANVSMSYIATRARVLKKQGKCGIVLIDYLQLCREKGLQGRSREQEVSAMSREAKIIAKELDIPVILLSQLSRSVEQREKKKPQLSDLRDSGSIEQDADLVIFIYRPEYYGGKVENSHGEIIENCGELHIEKNRDGATGVVQFRHNAGLTKIYDYDYCPQNTPF